MTDTLQTRFWQKVNKNGSDGCWIWLGSRLNSGYGQIGLTSSQNMTVHRLSWMLHYGEIPPGMNVCHHCDNRICVNPEHLFLATPKENTQDAIQKGRRDRRGEKHPLAKLTEGEVRELRTLYSSGSHSVKELAHRYGLSKSGIYSIVTHASWKHLG